MNESGITTTHSGHKRNPTPPAVAYDEEVAPAQPLERQSELSKSVVLIGVDASLVEDNIWLKLVNDKGQVVGQDPQILLIAQPIREVQVERALLLPRGEVLFAMHRESKDRTIVTKDGRRAVSLVNVAIDDGAPADTPVALKDPDSDGNVVENTVSLAVIGVGVVGAAGKIGSKSVVERAPRSKDRPLDGGTGAPNQPF